MLALVSGALLFGCKKPSAPNGAEATTPNVVDAGLADVASDFDAGTGPLVELHREGPRSHFYRYGAKIDRDGSVLLNGDGQRATNFRGCGTRTIAPKDVAQMIAILQANDAMSLTGPIPSSSLVGNDGRQPSIDDGVTSVSVTQDGKTKQFGYLGSFAGGTAATAPGEGDRVRAIADAITTISGADPWNPDTPYTPCGGFPNDRGAGSDPPPPVKITFSIQLEEKGDLNSSLFIANIDEETDGTATAAMTMSPNKLSGRTTEACPRTKMDAKAVAKLKAAVTPSVLDQIPKVLAWPRSGPLFRGVNLHVILDNVTYDKTNFQGPVADPKLTELVTKIKALSPIGNWEKSAAAQKTCVRPRL